MSPWSPWRKRMDGKASSATDATWSASLVRRKSPFTVVDKYQGRGLGTALLRHLAVIARQGGLRELVALCIAGQQGNAEGVREKRAEIHCKARSWQYLCQVRPDLKPVMVKSAGILWYSE